MAEDNDKDEGGEHEDPIDEQADAVGGPLVVDDEPAPVPMIRKLDKGIGILEQVAVASFLAALISIAAYKGISATFLGEDPAWTKQLIWHLMFLVAMASAALSVQTHQIIKMDFVTRKVQLRTRLILRISTNLFAVSVLCFLCYQSWKARAGFEDAPEFLDDRLVATALPIASGLIMVHLFLHSIVDGIYLSRGLEPPEAEMSGH